MEDKISQYWLPILWFIGFVFFLIVGAVTGWVLSHNGFSRVMHDSYYVLAHYHYMFSVGGTFLFFVLWYALFSKISGYRYNDLLGWLHFWILFLGMILSFIAQHFIGMVEMPRRVADLDKSYGLWTFIGDKAIWIINFSFALFFIGIILAFYEKKRR